MRAFSPNAQRVLGAASEEAERLHRDPVGTEHLLLGLIKVKRGIAIGVLRKLGLDLESVRLEVERQAEDELAGKMVWNIPFTPQVRSVLARAENEAENLNHSYVGTEHILLGILGESEGAAVRVLKHLNVTIERVRELVLTELDPDFSAAEFEPNKGRYELGDREADRPIVVSNPRRDFSTDANWVLEAATREADRLYHNYVGSEHLLLGLLRLDEGVALDALRNSRLQPEVVRLEVEKQVGIGPPTSMIGPLPYTPRVKKIVALAALEARDLAARKKAGVAIDEPLGFIRRLAAGFRRYLICPEHLLLGLLREGKGVAARVLFGLQVNPQRIREEILRRIDLTKRGA